MNQTEKQSEIEDHSELIELCGKVRDDSITTAEFSRLETLLADSAALDYYRRFMSLCSQLEQMGQADTEQAGEQSAENGFEEASFQWANDLDAELDADLERASDHAPSTPSANSPSLPVATKNEKQFRWRLWSGVIGAVAALVIIAGFYFRGGGSQDPATPQAPILATLINTHQADWNGEHNPSETGMSAGDYSLASGAAQIRFENGAELLVHAPVRFSLDEASQASLQSGSLTLYVPPTATGFQVQTPWGAVIDRGTRIGIHAEEEYGLEVHVFEGEAEFVGKSFEGAPSESALLAVGEALAVKQTNESKIERMPAEPKYFAETLTELSNLPIVSGDVELLVSPPRSVRRVRGEVCFQNRAMVFAERKGEALAEDLPVTLSEVGSPTSLSSSEQVVSAGSKVDSFLVHIAMPKELRNTSQVVTASGEVQFGRPILGLVSHELRLSGDLLGHPSTEYPRDTLTGLEDNGADFLEISPDRRTLKFRLSIHGREHNDELDFIDQIRILVEAP